MVAPLEPTGGLRLPYAPVVGPTWRQPWHSATADRVLLARVITASTVNRAHGDCKREDGGVRSLWIKACVCCSDRV